MKKKITICEIIVRVVYSFVIFMAAVSFCNQANSYQLPYVPGDENWAFTQGPYDDYSHSNEYAWDMDWGGGDGLGQPVFAPEAGIVDSATGYDKPYYGNMVYIDYGGNSGGRLAHLDEIFVGSGERVEQGQVIGTLGGSGCNATGQNCSGTYYSSHIHYSTVEKNGSWHSKESELYYIQEDEGDVVKYGSPQDSYNHPQGSESYIHASANSNIFREAFNDNGGQNSFGIDMPDLVVGQTQPSYFDLFRWYDNTYNSNDTNNCYIFDLPGAGLNDPWIIYDALHGARSAVVIFGRMKQYWESLGGPNSSLANPLLGEYIATDGLTHMYFQGGYLVWNGSQGTLTQYTYPNTFGPGACHTGQSSDSVLSPILSLPTGNNIGWSPKVSYLFVEAYKRNIREGKIPGYPYAGAYGGSPAYIHIWENSDGNDYYVQNFHGGNLKYGSNNQYDDCIVIYDSRNNSVEDQGGENKAYLIRQGFWEWYKNNNGISVLGAPLIDEYTIAFQPYTSRQDFEKGLLLWNIQTLQVEMYTYENDPTDGGSGGPDNPDLYEPNDDVSSAVNVNLNSTVYGYIYPAEDLDWYKVWIDQQGTLTINLTNLPYDYDVYLYNTDGSVVLASSTNSNNNNENINYSNFSQFGYYYINVKGWQGANDATNPYRLNIGWQSGSQSEYEYGDSTTTSYVLTYDPWTPVDNKNYFYDGETVYHWLELIDVMVPFQVRWDWYTPRGLLYRSSQSGWIALPEGGGYWGWYHIPDLLTLPTGCSVDDAIENYEGTWWVAFYVMTEGSGQYQYVGSDSFYLDILKAPAKKPSISVTPNPSENGNYTISWTLHSDDQDGSVTGYRIQEDNDSSFNPPTYDQNFDNTSITNMQFTSKPLGTYWYRVCLLKNNCLQGEWSNPISVTVVEPDADDDNIADTSDNCDYNRNPDQWDTDGDGLGNACDDTPYTVDNTLKSDETFINAKHITELRGVVNAIRASRGFANYDWTDPDLSANSTIIKADHINDLRYAIDGFYSVTWSSPHPIIAYNPITGEGTEFDKKYIEELRNVIKSYYSQNK